MAIVKTVSVSRRPTKLVVASIEATLSVAEGGDLVLDTEEAGKVYPFATP